MSAYSDKVRDWKLTEEQDRAYQLPIRPHPMPEFETYTTEAGEELPDRTRPVSTPVFTREVSADGKVWVIRTPLKYTKPSTRIR